MSPPLNVAFWSRWNAGQQDDESVYIDALRTHNDPLARAKALWDWKDLSRGVDVDAVVDAVSTEELYELVGQPPSEAVAVLGEKLVGGGALANPTVVTPAFLLHVTASGLNEYSTRFPLFDVRCWVAYVYLAGRRTGDEPLPGSATQSAPRFGAFSEFFQETIPQDVPGRVYEHALFRFGAYIAALPSTTVANVDEHLLALEDAVCKSYESEGYAIIR